MSTMITHTTVERSLLNLAVRQVTTLFGRTVWRTSRYHWSVDYGAPLLLLPTIDCLMCRRSVLCYDAGDESIPGGN
jgi:hypothetical protein